MFQVPVVLVHTIKSYVCLYYYYMRNACYLSYIFATSFLYEEKTVFLKISQRTTHVYDRKSTVILGN